MGDDSSVLMPRGRHHAGEIPEVSKSDAHPEQPARFFGIGQEDNTVRTDVEADPIHLVRRQIVRVGSQEVLIAKLLRTSRQLVPTRVARTVALGSHNNRSIAVCSASSF